MKQRVLIVDDESRNIRILQLTLGNQWDVKTAASGEEALSVVEEFMPDVVLLDIMMPGINGYEVCRLMKANRNLEFTKIILVTGKAMLEERLQGYEAGADDYVTKPFIPDEMVAKVQVFLRLSDSEKKLRALNDNLEAQVKERTAQLIDAEARLVNVAKMSALGEMASGIAHEINTPLAAINRLSDQMSELMGDEVLNKDLLSNMSKKVGTLSMRIAKIISGLRTFARDGQHDPFTHARLEQIVSETLDLCRSQMISRGIELRMRPIAANLLLDCRPTQISQVILNLLNNAADAIANLDERWIELDINETETSIFFRITDSGKGISPEIREKLFQPFFTTKGVGKGTGLGLSISKGIIESHNGALELDLDSERTSFRIHVPKKQSISKAAVEPNVEQKKEAA